MVEEMKTVADFDKALQDNELVFADFFATWCGPCKMLAPIVEKISGTTPDVKFVKVDVDRLGPLAARYGIASIPTVIVFRNGEKSQQAVGFLPESKLADLIRSA